MPFNGQINPLQEAITSPTQANLRTRRLQTVRVLILLGAPAVLLIALTGQGWGQVLETERTVMRVHGAVQRSLRVAALIIDLQVERGRTTMLLSLNQSLEAGPRRQLLLDRRKSDEKAQRIEDWSYINITAHAKPANIKQRPQFFSVFLTGVRALIDKGAANMTFTLSAYTSLIRDLTSSLMGGLQDEEQHVYLPAFHSFMLAGDKVGLLRAQGSAMWVSCEGGQSARINLSRQVAQYVALIYVGTQQSAPLRAAFAKVGVEIEVMVQELEDAVADLISNSFKYKCETASAEVRLRGGEEWFENMTEYIQRISYVREALIVALQKTIDDLMYGIKTMALVYSLVIVLTIFCTIGSAFTAFSSIKTSWKLHDLSQSLTEKRVEVESERARCHEMLSQMLPPYIADQLRKKGKIRPEHFEDVTIFFSSIADIGSFSNRSKPDQIIGFLNSLQEIYDQAEKRYDVCRIDTIGHACMLASGLPIRNGDNHASNIAHMSIAIQQRTKDLDIQLRIGIHSGTCVAGIIGHVTPRYCVFGDTVIIASKMEASGEGTKIHLTESTRDRLDRAGGFVVTPNTSINLQEKLREKTYWLEAYMSSSTGNRSPVTLEPGQQTSGWKKTLTPYLSGPGPQHF